MLFLSRKKPGPGFVAMLIFLISSAIMATAILFSVFVDKPAPAIELTTQVQAQSTTQAATKASNAGLKDNVTTAPLVTVVEVSKQPQQPQITAYGEASARWSTQLLAEVNGRVEFVSDKLLSGSAFKQGDLLASINDLDYQGALLSAKADVASARVIYLEQQRETEQAKLRWQISELSGSPSPLTLQQPQLIEAKAKLDAASAALTSAEKNLSGSEIRAPYNGRVISRNINLGGYVSTGGSIAHIFATDVIEVSIGLTGQQFLLLGDEQDVVGQQVLLTDTSNDKNQWLASIARFQYNIDSDDRTRYLILTVGTGEQQKLLMPGTFVKAAIDGKKQPGLLKLPASALTKTGDIWLVEQGKLQRFSAPLSYRQDDYILVKGPVHNNDLQVVRTPQSSFLSGQVVETQVVELVWQKTFHSSLAQVTDKTFTPEMMRASK